MSSLLSRRQALRSAGFAGLGLCAWRGIRAGEPAPSEKLNLAFVGAGGRAVANMGGLRGHNFVAFCDVDERRCAATIAKYPDVPRFSDFRKMLEQLDRRIDAVVVSAPNHIHAPASVMAMRMGKHVYCEKPLSHSVHEARVAAQVAAEKKVATQMGTQIHAGANYRRAIELLQAGAIGPVREVEVWTMAAEGGGERPSETPAVPSGLQWDQWIGPAPMRPYHPCYLPRQWHFWWDFGGGVLGNVGCHFMDLPFWALKLGHPTTVEAEGPPVHAETTPKTMVIRYEFAARGDLPPVRLTWYQGRRSPRVESEKVPAWNTGFLFIGEKGMLLADYTRRVLLPEARFAGFQAPEPTIPDSPGHYAEWVAACKTGSPTGCSFDYAGPLTEAMLLGNVAYRAGRKISWDGGGMKVTDCAEANAFLRREYRRGWVL